MVRSVIIARIYDGLPLSATMDDGELENEFPDCKAQCKAVIKSFASQTEPFCSVEAGSFFIHYALAMGIGYLCVCDKLYPKRLAFGFLEELQREFEREFGPDKVESASRPYAFIKFDTQIQKLKRSFQDVRTKQNVTRLQEELAGVTSIMTTNIKEVLERGNKLDQMSKMSTAMSSEARRFAKDSRQLNIDALYRKYGPPAIVICIIILVLYIWIKWF